MIFQLDVLRARTDDSECLRWLGVSEIRSNPRSNCRIKSEKLVELRLFLIHEHFKLYSSLKFCRGVSTAGVSKWLLLGIYLSFYLITVYHQETKQNLNSFVLVHFIELYLSRFKASVSGEETYSWHCDGRWFRVFPNYLVHFSEENKGIDIYTGSCAWFVHKANLVYS